MHTRTGAVRASAHVGVFMLVQPPPAPKQIQRGCARVFTRESVHLRARSRVPVCAPSLVEDDLDVLEAEHVLDPDGRQVHPGRSRDRLDELPSLLHPAPNRTNHHSQN